MPNPQRMVGCPLSRRAVLAGTTLLFGGCLGEGQQLTADTDGYPPPADSQPPQRTIDTANFERITVEGTQVPLAPIEATYYWYQRREARFADARGEHSYDRAHIEGAVLSPARSTLDDSPVAMWPKSDRIVCYCGCPHHLSSIRAATLIQNGYDNVYVIDEGFGEWVDRTYPIAGTATNIQPPTYHLTGYTDPQYAGTSAWAWHDPTGQREATRIHSDGRYDLTLHFTDLTPNSRIRIDTPEYEQTAPLHTLVDTPITG